MTSNTQCVNTNGSYECICVDGYELVDDECQREINTLLLNFNEDLAYHVFKALLMK